MGKRLLPVIIVVVVLFGVLYQGLLPEKKAPVASSSTPVPTQPSNNVNQSAQISLSIDEKTQANTVANYLQRHQQLPDFYLTKKEARENGWNAKTGNLCEVLPGRAIGGDRFMNREKQLPEEAKRQWYEADVNYRCGHRGSDRLLYSNDGLIYVTTDHYRTMTKVEP
ncbi:ribonuclease domain-containing protein [Proteus sp. FME41]|uniref:ribonuclease domain-containing protein n=1 Tax=Proteus sp. FME41 TaxID=2742608 RepID=UPI00186861FA|nr:ribonuclease domain-containing protein [Proteus sp. FME41]